MVSCARDPAGRQTLLYSGRSLVHWLHLCRAHQPEAALSRRLSEPDLLHIAAHAAAVALSRGPHCSVQTMCLVHGWTNFRHALILRPKFHTASDLFCISCLDSVTVFETSLQAKRDVVKQTAARRRLMSSSRCSGSWGRPQSSCGRACPSSQTSSPPSPSGRLAPSRRSVWHGICAILF